MFENFGQFLWHITDKIVSVYEKLNQWAVKEIVRRIVKTGELNKASVNQIYKMREAGMTMEAIQQEVAKHSPLSEAEVKKVFEDAAIESTKEDEKLYEEAGVSHDTVLESEKMQTVLETANLQTNNELKNICRTMANSSEKIFIEALDDAYMKVQSGMASYEQAITQAIQEVAKGGLYITYPSGKKDHIETAVRRALMTGLNQGTIRMKLEQIKNNGFDLIATSQHLGARTGGKELYEDHSRWQGKVYSISGTSKKYPSFVEECGWGKGGGIGGWNCRHHIYAFIEGVSELPKPMDVEENKRVEKLNKTQRRLESEIRAKKRELIGLKEAMEVTSDNNLKFELSQQYDKTAYELREMRKKYDNFCGENNLKTWDERLKVVKFEREQSYEARLGANRYAKDLKQTGGRKVVDYSNYDEFRKEHDRREKHARKYYESVRNSDKQAIITAISKNIGKSENYVKKVIDHVFVNKYNLSTGYETFLPDYEIAESFRRIREGKNILPHDITMMKHEHLECGLMNKLGYKYDLAHDITNRKYNYQKEVREYEGKLKNGKNGQKK